MPSLTVVITVSGLKPIDYPARYSPADRVQPVQRSGESEPDA